MFPIRGTDTPDTDGMGHIDEADEQDDQTAKHTDTRAGVQTLKEADGEKDGQAGRQKQRYTEAGRQESVIEAAQK